MIYSEKEIADYLDKWFDSVAHEKRVWNRNPVGKIIKSKLTEMGRWRNKPRGKLNEGFYKNRAF